MIADILPVCIIIAAGFLLSLSRIADNSWVTILNRYGLYVGFPALIYVNLTALDRQTLIEQLPTFFMTIALITLTMLIIFVIVRNGRVKTGFALALLLASYNGNIGYLGFPLITSVLPQSGTTIALIISAYTITTFTLGLILIEAVSGQQGSFSDVLVSVSRSPFLIATGISLLVVITGIQTPAPLFKALDMIESSASPVVLLGLGIFIHKKIHLKAIWKPTLIITAVKMLVFPLVFLAAGMVVPLDGHYDVAILEAMMPVGITNFALADLFPIDKEIMVSVIIITTLLTPLIFPLFSMLI
jgi:predicted permease